ncbi:MAG: hypothetical protein F4114_11790 [Rhodospirillaceae bacterium]|nr:hypothetical protein [Rhodospirillaceae bacterium]MYI49749.1 hypothetical protein [Rhodospirillaceae bacterium]
MLRDAEKHLKHLGYELTPEGAGLAMTSQMSGYNAVEAASYISLLTLARDVDEAGPDLEKLTDFLSRATEMLHVLKYYKDKGMICEESWKNDSSAIWGVVALGEGQRQWIATVLNQETRNMGRLANFCGYNSRRDDR